MASTAPVQRPTADRLPVLPPQDFHFTPLPAPSTRCHSLATLSWAAGLPPPRRPSTSFLNPAKEAQKWTMFLRQPKPSLVDVPLPPPTYVTSHKEGEMLHEQRVHSIDIKGYGSARHQRSLPRHHFPMRCLRSPPLCHPPASLPNPDKESQEVGHTALVAQAIPCRQATTSILQWSSPQRRGGCPQKEGVAWPTSKETSHRPPQVCCHPPWPDDDEGLPLLLAISGCPQLLRRLPRRRRHLARCQDHRSPPLPAAPPASALAGRPRLLPLLPPARRASTATTANRPRRRRPPAVAALAAASEPCCC